MQEREKPASRWAAASVYNSCIGLHWIWGAGSWRASLGLGQGSGWRGSCKGLQPELVCWCTGRAPADMQYMEGPRMACRPGVGRGGRGGGQ